MSDLNTASATPAAAIQATANLTAGTPAPFVPRTRGDFDRLASEALGAVPAPAQGTATPEASPAAPDSQLQGLSDDGQGTVTQDSADGVVSDGAPQAGETAEDPDAEADEPADETAGQWPAAAVDRIQRHKAQRDKARDKAKALEAENEALRQQVAAAQKPDVSDVGEKSPFAKEYDPQKIAERQKMAGNNLKTVNALLDRVDKDPDGVAEALERAGVKLDEYTPDIMREELQRIRDGEQAILAEGPQRIEFLRAERESFHGVAVVAHPSLKDPSSELSKMVEQVVQIEPVLRKRPDWAFHAACYAEGFQLAQARLKSGKPAAPAKPTTPAKPKLAAPPKLPSVGPSPAKAVGSDRLEALRQRAMSPGATRVDMDAYAAAAAG